jgi:hypothetical protein
MNVFVKTDYFSESKNYYTIEIPIHSNILDAEISGSDFILIYENEDPYLGILKPIFIMVYPTWNMKFNRPENYKFFKTCNVSTIKTAVSSTGRTITTENSLETKSFVIFLDRNITTEENREERIKELLEK